MTEPFDLSLVSANAVIAYCGDFFELPEDIFETINSFTALSIGWDYGRGGPVSDDVRGAAIKWAKYLEKQGFSNLDASPGNNNEIILASSTGDHYFELIVQEAGVSSLAYDYKRKQVFFHRGLSEDETKALLAEIEARIWSASDYFIQINTMRRSVNLIDLHFPTVTNFYQLWTGTAYKFQEPQLPITFESTIRNLKVSPGNLQSFGSLIPLPNSRPVT